MLFYYIFSVCFCIIFLGLIGLILKRNNVVTLLLILELLLVGISFLFLFLSLILNEILGQFISLIILTLAASETAIGLTLVSILYKINATVNTKVLEILKK